ncbi:putative receptor-like protein kinase At5g39000 [Arachis stenosperma]|uniref:putative receptor-like protein kinase At5g39000 n=1 Tax=Arachis stenosperma TaxID=217475 RepID=UPI0025ABE32F|nr:putative receptor-like protein kinase At5g39000 [Arachis stenosperma]
MFLKCLRFADSKKGGKYPIVIEEQCHHFSFEALRKATNDFDENLQIGEGGFGKLYKGCLKHNNGDASDHTIALKVMPIWMSHEYYEFKKEIEMLCELRHTNIISLIGFCYRKQKRIVVYEYMVNGSLHDYLNNKNKEPLSWKKRLEICIGVARALHYLHVGAKRCCIIHRDIKPHNILLDGNMVPKISGFELSLYGALSASKEKKIEVDCVAGTVGYIAPEHIRHGYVTDKSDVFSFGIVLQFVMGHDVSCFKHDADTLEETIDPNLNGKIAPECWQVFTSVIQRCLQHEADERPTMGEVEILLENALSLQEQADITNTNAAHYTLLSTTCLSHIFSGCISNGNLTFDASMEEGSFSEESSD